MASVYHHQIFATVPPYPPSNIKVNGVSWPASIAEASTYNVTWSYRDRVLQADQLIDCLAGNIGPELGTIYRLEVVRKDTAAVVWSAETTLNAFTVPYTASSSGQAHILRIGSRRDGLASFYHYTAELPRGYEGA